MKKIEGLITVLNLKDEKRTGWQLRNIEDPESVADHSWGVALLTLIYSEKVDINEEKALKMALIHDIAEAETGDFVTRKVDDKQEIEKEEKEKLEKEAVEKLSGLLGEELEEIWMEYEERETDEAKFVKDMDLIDMCLTALKYEKENRYNPEEENEDFQEYENLDEFFATTKPRITTLKGQKLFREIEDKYQEAKQ
ncbi:MAG: phosphohydrolase [Nanohaloarchaea archaeon QH_8_44_6]|nr:MAG: phosphohydrolase [Nanohaloarchaea archaeon QH_8_44_6]